MSTSSVELHRGHILSPVSLDALAGRPDGALVVDGDGRLVAVGDFGELRDRYREAPVRDWRPCLILPGLVDVHSHIAQYGARALDGYDLLPWLERFIFPAEAAFADPDHALALSRRFFASALACGTTSMLLYATVHVEATEAAFRAAEEAGVRATIGKVMMDRNAPPDLLEDTATSLAESEELCSRWHGACGGRLRYAFTPRFAVTCSEELLRGAGRLAQGSSALVQTHLAENLDELRTVAGLFPDAPHYTGVYERAGLLGPQTVMAHCLYLSDGEWDLLARTGTRIAHCPRSNFLLRSGVFDMAQARSRALAVGLGTDVGAGPNLSLPEEMAAACFASRARETLERAAAARLDSLRSDLAAMPGGAELLETIRSRLQLGDTVTLVGPKMAFYLATLGSARVLGLADQIGSLEPGKQADFVVVDLNATEVDPIAAQSSEELVCQFTHHAAALAVRAVFIGGRCVHPPEPVRPR